MTIPVSLCLPIECNNITYFKSMISTMNAKTQASLASIKEKINFDGLYSKVSNTSRDGPLLKQLTSLVTNRTTAEMNIKIPTQESLTRQEASSSMATVGLVIAALIVLKFFIAPNLLSAYLHFKGKRTRIPKSLRELTRKHHSDENTLPEIVNRKEVEAMAIEKMKDNFKLKP